ncbi:hypothetical protein ACFX1S_016192 [Malus domestica]
MVVVKLPLVVGAVLPLPLPPPPPLMLQSQIEINRLSQRRLAWFTRYQALERNT